MWFVELALLLACIVIGARLGVIALVASFFVDLENAAITKGFLYFFVG